jgi:hypothetical protein
MIPRAEIFASVTFDPHIGIDPSTQPPTSVTVTVSSDPSLGRRGGGSAPYTYQLGNFRPQYQYAEAIMERPTHTDRSCKLR